MSQSSKVLCLGEVSWDRCWVVDRLPEGEGDSQVLNSYESSGGCALNTAMALGRASVPVVLFGNSIGVDAFGERILSDLESRNVMPRIERSKNISTPLCQTLLEKKSGRRSFVLDHRSMGRFDEDLLSKTIEEASSGMYPIAFLQHYTKKLCMEFVRRTVPKNFDFVMTQDVEASNEIVPHVDAVQLSLGEKEVFEEKSIQEKVLPYFQGRCRMIFVTAGDKGVAFVEKGKSVTFFKAMSVKNVVDTTGCGDTFRAGLLQGLFSGKHISDAIALGQELAAEKAQNQGSHL